MIVRKKIFRLYVCRGEYRRLMLFQYHIALPLLFSRTSALSWSGRIKSMAKENSGMKRGSWADQIALICCASGKNVNARRPLVIQPQLWDLLFPSSLHFFLPTCPPVLILPHALHGCPYLRFYVRLCVLATSIRDRGERKGARGRIGF